LTKEQICSNLKVVLKRDVPEEEKSVIVPVPTDFLGSISKKFEGFILIGDSQVNSEVISDLLGTPIMELSSNTRTLVPIIQWRKQVSMLLADLGIDRWSQVGNTKVYLLSIDSLREFRARLQGRKPVNLETMPYYFEGQVLLGGDINATMLSQILRARVAVIDQQIKLLCYGSRLISNLFEALGLSKFEADGIWIVSQIRLEAWLKIIGDWKEGKVEINGREYHCPRPGVFVDVYGVEHRITILTDDGFLGDKSISWNVADLDIKILIKPLVDEKD
jgi:hypothetical protein